MRPLLRSWFFLHIRYSGHLGLAKRTPSHAAKVFFYFLKTHGLRNKSWKFHNCTIICSGGYFHVPNPGQYMQITVCHFRKVTNKLLSKKNQKSWTNTSKFKIYTIHEWKKISTISIYNIFKVGKIFLIS